LQTQTPLYLAECVNGISNHVLFIYLFIYLLRLYSTTAEGL